MADLFFSAADGRFRDAGGRFVSDAKVRAVVDSVADAASSRMASAAERLLANEISLGAWEAEMRTAIRTSHVATSVLGHGGAASMDYSKWGSAGNTIKGEYGYLSQFAADIASGVQPLNRTIVSRSQMYGQASRVTYENIRGAAAQARGLDECRNLLHANESCDQCRGITTQGWMPASEMPPVGSRTCRSRCRCTIERRSSAAARAA